MAMAMKLALALVLALALAMALALVLALACCCTETPAGVVALTSAIWRKRFGIGECFRAVLEVLRCNKMATFLDEQCAPCTLAQFVRDVPKNNLVLI
jgi:hypothetical protein